MGICRALRCTVVGLTVVMLAGVLTVSSAVALDSSSSQPTAPLSISLPSPVSDSAGLDDTQAKYAGSRRVGASGRALLIQDVNPWERNSIEIALTTYRIPHDTVTSWSLSGISLTPYTFIVYASDQPTTYYENIAASIGRIEGYVSAGGALLAHVTDQGWSNGEWAGCDILPADVEHVDWYSNDLEINATNDPVITGKPDGVETLTGDYFDGWHYSAHGYFTNLPPGCVTVLSNEGSGGSEPVYIKYGYGTGVVRATMTTIQWGFGDGPGGAYNSPVGQRLGFLANELMTVFTKKVFAPKPNGWNIVNGSDKKTDDDRAVWEHLYGSDPLIFKLYDRAVARAKSRGKKGIFDGGNCFGFAASAGAYFMNYRHFHDFGISGVSTPWQWGRWGSFPKMNVFNGSATKGTRPKVLFEVEEFQATQWEYWTEKYRRDNTLSRSYPKIGRTWSRGYGKALVAFVDDLRLALRGEPQLLSMWNKKNGHSVLAYRLTKKGSGIDTEYRIWVYDSNYPGSNSCFVGVRPGRHAWSYNPDSNRKDDYGSAQAGDRIDFLSPAIPARAVNATRPVTLADRNVLPAYSD